jgi:hypothetical protein
VRLAWAFLAALAAGCGESSTVVFVTVEGRPTVTGATVLRVTLANGEDEKSQDFPLPASAELPQTFTVTPDGRAGDLTITVAALDDDLVERAVGSANQTIVDGGVTQVTVRLEPNDFVLNQMIATGQTLTVNSGHSGRQLAVGDGTEGGFVALWENFCPLARCDILARRFDARAAPSRNGTTLSLDDFLVNQTAEFTTTPAIAAGVGGYLAAWRGASDIRASALANDGAHLGATDLTVTSSDVAETAPTVFARVGGYVVAWEQIRAGMADTEIRARLYDENGQPVSGEFAVSELSSGDQTLPSGTTVPGNNFLVTWLHREGIAVNVRGRIFASSGAVVTAGDLRLTNLGSSEAAGSNVARTSEGFVLVWRGNPLSIFLARYAEDGTSLSTAIPMTETPTDLDATATVAVRADGAIGVAWHACDTAAGNIDCDIRFRMVHPDGLPSGPELVVNTTRAGRQDGPSIAPFGPDAFIVVWTDSSGLPPDTDGDSVRGRVIYPSLQRQDGTIGASCEGEADCNPGLTCGGNPDALRCHPACDAAAEGDPCPEGGVCTGGVCSFL